MASRKSPPIQASNAVASRRPWLFALGLLVFAVVMLGLVLF
jgi:hypothetical protein